MMDTARIRWIRGKLFIECDAVIRVPISLQPITQLAAERFKLTQREGQALDGVLKGLSNKEIGTVLNISERTVKFHVSEVLRKYGFKSRHQLVHRFGTL